MRICPFPDDTKFFSVLNPLFLDFGEVKARVREGEVIERGRQRFLPESRGFTLLEVIVTLIISSILGAMLVQFMGTNLTASVRPVIRTQNVQALQQVMENIIIEYNNLMATDATPLTTLKNRIEADDTRYGTNYKRACSYVTYANNGTECAGGSTILKVTISMGGDVSLTTLFAQ